MKKSTKDARDSQDPDIAGLGQSGVSITSVHGLMKKAQEYCGTVVALGTTGLSIYTGLKGIVGS